MLVFLQSEQNFEISEYLQDRDGDPENSKAFSMIYFGLCPVASDEEKRKFS